MLFSPEMGDEVTIGGGGTIYVIENGPDNDGEFKLIEKYSGVEVNGYYSKDQLKKYKFTENKITLGGFPCTYKFTPNKVTISHRGSSYDFPYIGNLTKFLKANEGMIAGFYQLQVEQDVNAIMIKFGKNFQELIKSLQQLILPHTKDLLLSIVITTIKENTLKVADLFKDKTIKNTLLKLFK